MGGTFICFSLATLCPSPVTAKYHISYRLANDTESICRPFGECEPCPQDVVCCPRFYFGSKHDFVFPSQLREPFCQPFGNRRLLHCLPPSHPSFPDPVHSDTDPHPKPDNFARPTSVDHPPGSHTVDEILQHQHPDGKLLPGETVAWESCGRIVVQERADFWEFIACNMVFVCIALVLVFLRSRRMNTMHARQLAARIGLGRGYD
jgi:hypothetical protein